ncbi:MAG: V-type ATP synthase subunit K [Candidatus Hydrogenedentes bacterium]|nr:V-type ATP synthase subunit K [Candidatus Hydrogenedentota bacterium]MBI3118383.1 V-type ATP synthase subunit K [Candidatus Hydrogenedentota bacterium]
MWNNLLIELARGSAFAGAAIAVCLGGAGSAKGISLAAQQAAGALSEKPELFGKLLVMIALPGTQGFYAFITAVLMASRSGLISGKLMISPGTGLALLFVGIATGIIQYLSAIKQGEASAAGISLVARRPEESGRALLFPALVETYAVVGLLAAILMITWLTNAGSPETPSNVLEYLNLPQGG